ncbi:uncharacterized protein JCM10292_003209 [Rhodotorula paludigena]|uniref:uncharacterized protein n=1 Tax=Rhodotorula paludigena TaxID=86838 RepID=UPI00317238D3
MSTNASAVWSFTTAYWSATPTATASSTSSTTSSYRADWATQYEDTDGWYTGPWSHYDQDDRNFNASDYSGGTASVCTTWGGQPAYGEDNCEVRVSFTGKPRVSGHGVTQEPTTGATDGMSTYALYMYGTNAQNLQFDYAVSDNTQAPGNGYFWNSDLSEAVPPQPFRNTTDLPLLPSFTAVPERVSYVTASSSPSPFSSGSDSNLPLILGLVLGLGGGLLATCLALFWLYKRRRRRAGAPEDVDGGSVRKEAEGPSPDGDKEEPLEVPVIVHTMATVGSTEEPQPARQLPALTPLYTSPPRLAYPYGYSPTHNRSPPRLSRHTSAQHGSPTSPSDSVDPFGDLPANATLEDPANFQPRL